MPKHLDRPAGGNHIPEQRAPLSPAGSLTDSQVLAWVRKKRNYERLAGAENGEALRTARLGLGGAATWPQVSSAYFAEHARRNALKRHGRGER